MRPGYGKDDQVPKLAEAGLVSIFAMISIRGVLVAAMAALIILPAAAQERRYTSLDYELEYLMEIWPGDFNNREQVQFDADGGMRDYESGAQLRVHGQYAQVDLPAFGEHVLFVEEYQNDDPKSVFRERLYVLSADETENAIRIKIHFFNDKEKWLGAHDDPSILDGITPDDTTTNAACDLLLRRNGAYLTGGIKDRGCTSSEGEEEISSEFQIRVGEDSYAFRSRFLSTTTGEEVLAISGFRWHELRRARWFQCMIDFPYEVGKPAMYTEHYARVHDQGGIFAFTHPDGRPMALSMRNRWSYGMQRDSFVIKVHDGGEPAPDLVYAWGSPGDDRIGLNPGWIRVQCDLDTPQNRKFQQDLRSGS